MAAVSDATTAVGSSADWSKVSELGLVSNNPDYFGSQVLNDNYGHYTFTVLDDIPGNHLLRAEVIALHVASSDGGAQFYPACPQVNVTGGGSAQPPTVKTPRCMVPVTPVSSSTSVRAWLHTPFLAQRPTAPRAPIVTTAYPTTTTWNTAIMPTTVPTTTPAPGATRIGA